MLLRFLLGSCALSFSSPQANTSGEFPKRANLALMPAQLQHFNYAKR